MVKFLGRENDLLLFADGSRSVIVNESINVVTETGFTDVFLETHSWGDGEFSQNAEELADAALSTLDVSVTASAGRLYTIPKSVQSEAKRALEWFETHQRGGTPVALSVAKELSYGGQVSIGRVRQIARFFPRHTEFASGEGWHQADNGYPSKNRVTWGLWGGDAAQRWTFQIAQAENDKALTADGFSLPGYDSLDQEIGPDLDAFQQALEINGEQGPEFIARVRMDGSGIDRLYKVDLDETVYAWDDDDWTALGQVGGDIWTYDRSLDDVYDSVDKTHVIIDPDSAIILAARFTENPFEPVSIADLDAEESHLAADAADELDYDSIDDAVVAAAPPAAPPGAAGDGQYTPQERSQNAEKQQRDATGKFATVGGRVLINKNPHMAGTITKIDQASGTATVALENGQPPVQVPIKSTSAISKTTPTVPNTPIEDPQVDLTGILAVPRQPIDSTMARLPGTLPAMTPGELHQLINDWPAFVKSQRTATPIDVPKPVKVKTNMLDIGDAGRAVEKSTGEKIIYDAYKHPLLAKWMRQRDINGRQNNTWFQPVTAAGEPAAIQQDAGTAVTPPTSDVAPIYMAVVAPDDPQAVTDLIALVPASTTSTAPMTYERKDGAWVRDPQMVNDLKSATPPPVVPLDSATLNDVLQQVDATQSSGDSQPTDQAQPSQPVAASISPDLALTVLWGPHASALIAAGGADRNRGQAEKLRRYWVHGEGAAKIRWGTPGDWTRCVAHLGKYMGDRAKGYCQLRHKEADGYYTGDSKNLSNNGALEFDITPEALAKPVLQHIDEAQGDPEFDQSFTPSPDIILLISDLFGDPQETQEGMLEDADLPLSEGQRYGLDVRPSAPVTAAGTIVHAPEKAEKLRRYWTVGPGGMKIQWGTGGDWTRCVRHLGKYLGPRAHGYCALRHKEMTGLWTGDKKHRLIYGRTGRHSFSTDVVKPEAAIIAAAWLRAEKAALRNRVKGLTASVDTAEQVRPGATFTIPLVIPEGVESGDGRMIKEDALTLRDLPLPLLWQQESADGHSGSVVVGRIDHMERIGNGIGNARGVFDNGEHGREAERLVRNGFLRGVSADMDQFEAAPQEDDSEMGLGDEGDKSPVKQDRLVISKARIMAVTIVPKPAFQECNINIDGADTPQEENVIPDGIYVDDVDPVEASALVAAGYVASAVPLTPPAEWFENPNLKSATPLTVGDDGRVYGHIAAWHQDHIGMAFGTRPPRSRSNYAYFHSGVVRTEEGNDVPVGQLTLAGGHASIEASASEAVKHYDDTASAIADVHAGEDQFGIWVAGSVRPGASPEQIRALRASAPSGDWRPIKGQLELVAVCQVNVPGFPIARARVASGQVYALVAAGAMTLAKMKSDPLAEMQARLNNLEAVHNHELSAKAEAARARVDEFRNKKNAELSAKVEALSARVSEASDFAFIPKKKRDEAASKGHALPDGSFPIENEADLKKAIHAYGRASADKKTAAKKHIQKRARALGVSNLIPDTWSTEQSAALTASVEEMRARIARRQEEFASGKALTPTQVKQEETARKIINQVNPVLISDDAAPPVPGKYTPKTQPRDEQGKFRLILARLRDNLGTSGNQAVLDKIKTVENLDNTGDYQAATNSAADLYNTINRMDTGALDKQTRVNLRTATRQLSTVIANLPLPFADQAQKVRFSDLPPALREMSQDFIQRVTNKLGTEKAAPIVSEMKAFMSGAQVYSQSEVSAQLNHLLRYLD